MGIKSGAIGLIERTPVPDAITRLGIEALVARSRRLLAAEPEETAERFAAAMAAEPIAAHTEAANDQHYEVPADFFRLVLGPQRKYSSCLYEADTATLAEAEEAALAETAAHARVGNGMSILELGCGWGSLSLWLAQRYPDSCILSVSNAKSQRRFVEGEIARRRLTNLRVVTADVNDFEPGETFDRVVSVEMFEHVSNWPALLARVKSWLKPDGLFFMHVFSHVRVPYRFDHEDEADWIARHFFTGGIMPSHNLIRYFPESFDVVDAWRWSGQHYQRTAEHWLANFDRHTEEIAEIFSATYGSQARLWLRRWRLFFLATAGLFGHRGGGEWGVSHILLRPSSSLRTPNAPANWRPDRPAA
jgi:cyclopropane-fatty-acyl-phospholipid synthase